MTNKGLESLSQSLKKMVSLKKIDLRFYGNFDINDSGIQNIIQGVKKLVALEEMTLKFAPDKKIINIGIEKSSKP